MLKKPSLFLLMLVGLLFACQSRYGYLSKVRVGSASKPKLEKNKPDKTNSDKEEETENDLITASSDTILILGNSSLFKKDKVLKSSQPNKVEEKKIGSKKFAKRKSRDADKNINYYAKWAFIMGLISLLTFPFIIPIFLGPVDILLGIIALKQIKKSGERGKGRAIYAIIIGLIATVFLLLAFIELTFSRYPFMPIPAMFLLALGVLVFNLIWYIFIKKGRKNPANKEEVEKRAPMDGRTKKLLKIAFVFAFLTALFSAFIFGLAFGPITLILSHTALKRMPKDGRNVRFITQMVLILGILATIGLLVLLYLFLAGLIIDYVLAILASITLLLAILITIIGFAIKSNFYLEDEY